MSVLDEPYFKQIVCWLKNTDKRLLAAWLVRRVSQRRIKTVQEAIKMVDACTFKLPCSLGQMADECCYGRNRKGRIRRAPRYCCKCDGKLKKDEHGMCFDCQMK